MRLLKYQGTHHNDCLCVGWPNPRYRNWIQWMSTSPINHVIALCYKVGDRKAFPVDWERVSSHKLRHCRPSWVLLLAKCVLLLVLVLPSLTCTRVEFCTNDQRIPFPSESPGGVVIHVKCTVSLHLYKLRLMWQVRTCELAQKSTSSKYSSRIHNMKSRNRCNTVSSKKEWIGSDVFRDWATCFAQKKNREQETDYNKSNIVGMHI